MQVTQNGYLSPQQIAELHKISVRTFERMTSAIRKRLRKKKKLKRLRLYSPSDVLELNKVLE